MLSDALTVFVVIAIAAVAFVLARGIGTFGRGGTENAHRSNRLMQWRIALQAGAVVLIVVVIAVRNWTGG